MLKKKISNQQPNNNLRDCKKNKLKASGREEIKTRAEINKIENRKIIEKINEAKSLFFENIKKTDRLLAGWNKKKEKKVSNY